MDRPKIFKDSRPRVPLALSFNNVPINRRANLLSPLIVRSHVSQLAAGDGLVALMRNTYPFLSALPQPTCAIHPSTLSIRLPSQRSRSRANSPHQLSSFSYSSSAIIVRSITTCSSRRYTYSLSMTRESQGSLPSTALIPALHEHGFRPLIQRLAFDPSAL